MTTVSADGVMIVSVDASCSYHANNGNEDEGQSTGELILFKTGSGG